MRRRKEAGTGRRNTCAGIMERISMDIAKSLGTKYLVPLKSDYRWGKTLFFRFSHKKKNMFDGSLEPPYPRSTP